MDEQTIQPTNSIPSGTPPSVAPAGSGGPVSPTPASGGQFGPVNTSSRMGLIIVAVVVAVAAIGGVLYLVNHKSTPASQTAAVQTVAPALVNITPGGFVPATVTVDVNQAVVWTNADSHPHGVASDPYPTDAALPGLNSGATQLMLHDRYSYIFKTAGAY